MCTRYALFAPHVLSRALTIAQMEHDDHFNQRRYEEPFAFRGQDIPAAPTYDARPHENLPILLAGGIGDERLITAHWGLLPVGAVNPDGFWENHTTFNARLDELLANRLYAKPLQQGQRCLVPMNGFYEWRQLSNNRVVRYFIHLRDPA